MQEPAEFYHSQIEKYRTHLQTASRKLNFSSLLRLFVFLAMAYAVYAFWENTTAVVASVLVGIVIFVLLVSRHSDLRYERDKFRELININETELQVLIRKFHDLPTGAEFADPLHPFSQDIDLFGRGSFFQYINRTTLTEGREKLAELLLSNDIDDIHLKQEAIKELAEKADWRQNFSAIATLVKTESRTATITNWLKNYSGFVPKMMKWLPLLFSALSGIVITAFFLDFIGGIELALWFFAGLLITGFFLKRINLLSSSVSKVQDTFHQYHQLLGLIENTSFSSELLKGQRQQVVSEKQKASTILKKFSKAIDSLDQRNNMIFGVLGNGFLL